jgi:hypothetical protein
MGVWVLPVSLLAGGSGLVFGSALRSLRELHGLLKRACSRTRHTDQTQAPASAAVCSNYFPTGASS